MTRMLGAHSGAVSKQYVKKWTVMSRINGGEDSKTLLFRPPRFSLMKRMAVRFGVQLLFVLECLLLVRKKLKSMLSSRQSLLPLSLLGGFPSSDSAAQHLLRCLRVWRSHDVFDEVDAGRKE